MIQEIKARRKKNEDELRAALKQMVSQLRSLGAERIILFGSLATGTVREWSDIDLLVVMPSNRSGKEWRRLVSEGVEREVACDLLVFTDVELKENLPASSFLRDILEEGVVLHGN